jgi:osmotically-inducible protein OsmY
MMAYSLRRFARLAVTRALSVAMMLVFSGSFPMGECRASELLMAAMSDGDGNNAVSDIQSDLDLKNAVQAELVWNDFVDRSQVRSDVDAGVVTLTGIVTTPAAQRAATLSAYQAGATAVRNFLRVGQE